MTLSAFAHSEAEFAERLAHLLARAQELNDIEMRRLAPNLPGERIEAERLRRYVRVIKVHRDNEADRSVYAFIDPENGDIYKAESWKKPAPVVRGNLYAPDNGFGCIDWHGAR